MTTTIVAGGGSAGACIAARLVEAGDDVILIEAGPDYGPHGSRRWPSELLDTSVLPAESHSWHYRSSASTGAPGNPLERARVIGGCSSHNGCAIVWSHHLDYDGWFERGLTHWHTDSVLPFLRKATEQLDVTIPAYRDVTPLHQLAIDSAPAAGYPHLPNLMDMQVTQGVFINPVNIKQRVRWNTAFAYLDPLRARSGLRIVANAMVDRVIVRGGAAVGVEVAGENGAIHFEADRVVLSAGAYGSPLILQRSGIGDPDLLSQFGIETVHPLPGVGRSLQDHPAVALHFAGTPALVERLDAYVAAGGLAREEGSTVLAASDRCPEAFDLHLYPVATRHGPGKWSVQLSISVMASRSTGEIRISDRAPAALPLIDHAYFSDADGYDLDALLDGVRIGRELVACEPLASLIGAELDLTRQAATRAELATLVPTISKHNYHPTSSCAMGLGSDPMAVVDQHGKVHGLDHLYVVDASIFPTTIRANTNLPAIAVAEKLAAALSAANG